MSEHLLENRSGRCPICGYPLHRRFYTNATLHEMIRGSLLTFRTWASLTRTFVRQKHPNPAAGWDILKRTINARPAGAATTIAITTARGSKRSFTPLPPALAPGKYDGCTIAAYAYDGVIVGPIFDPMEARAAVNERKKKAAELRSPRPDGGPK